LEYQGYTIDHVQNFTDIDDKIIQRAVEKGMTVQELSQMYIDNYFVDFDALNVKRASSYPRATEEIPSIIDIIKGLMEKGYAYAVGGDVHFRVSMFDGYGKLGHRSLDSMIAGARVKIDDQKDNPMDFVLWKAAKIGEPAWESPWGPGRPGWHVECTAMAYTYLGDQIDIHGGGQDLIFPHHENEIAQTEIFTGVAPFARFWVHNGLLHLGQGKMSKSDGDPITITEVLQNFSSDAVRLYFLSSHYRNPLAYMGEKLPSMERGALRLRTALRQVPDVSGRPVGTTQFKNRFIQAMDDDMNTPQAVAVLFDLAREINRANNDGRCSHNARQILNELGADLLGLTFQEPTQPAPMGTQPFVDLLVQTRNQLRLAKLYEASDDIRSSLLKLGVVLEDTAEGTSWQFITPDGS